MIRNNNVSSWAWGTCESPYKLLRSDSMQQQFSLGYLQDKMFVGAYETSSKTIFPLSVFS